MNKYRIVVARFNEDLSWLNDLDESRYDFVIYNKGEDNLTRSCIKVPNVGGDAETYIRYIIDNYENLPDYVVFIQGYVLDHCKNLIDIINNHTDEPFIPLADSDKICTESIHGWYERFIDRRPREMPITMLDTTARDILGNECPENVTFAAGQQYLVSRDIILRRSKEFYKYIFVKFPTEFLLPWHMERIWMKVWKIDG